MRRRLFDEFVEVEPPVYAPPEPREVEWVEDEPIGVILGPTGAPISVVMPERRPFGFQSRRHR